MISSLHIRNFRCIADLELGFKYDQKKAPNGYALMPRYPFIDDAGERLVPCMALYGANASGKSTVLRAVATLLRFATNRIHPLSVYQPYLLRDIRPDATMIEMSWTDGGQTYSYGVEVASDRIVGERLRLGDVVLFETQDGKVSFNQHDGVDSVIRGVKIQCIDITTNRQMRPLLPIIGNDFPGFDAGIVCAFRSLAGKFFYLDGTIPPYQGIQRLASTFDFPDLADRENAALDLVSSFLRKLDVRIQKIELTKTPTPISSLPLAMQSFLLSQEKSVSVQDNPNLTIDQIDFRAVHLSASGEEVKFNLTDESLGTQKLFGLLAFLLTAVRSGGVAIIDEIDDSLHSALIPEFLKLFTLRDYNNKKSQLFFTIHNTDLLGDDYLTVSEISFVSQHGFKGTQIRRLSSFENVRNVNNFRKQYLMGYYSAIPSAFI